MATGALIAKIVIGGVAGATAITPVVFYFAPPWAVELTKEKFEEFKKSYGFESCQTFLSADDKKHLLLLCLTKAEDHQAKTVHHYFYNGGSWEKALSLEKDPDNKSAGFFFVKTETWWGTSRRKINNIGDVQPKGLTEHDRLGMRCEFGSSTTSKEEKKNKKFVCFKNQSQYTLTWELKEFKID